MFWKIALALGFFGLMASLIIVVIAVRAFYASTDETTEDIAFGGLIIGVLLLVGSFLLTVVALFFVMRNSKRNWEADNPKPEASK